MTATLHGQNHSPKLNANWFYSVEAVDSHGQALAGSVATEFVYNGTVVGHEAPPTHPLTNGRLDDKVQFPPASLAIPLVFQVVVTTADGSVTLDWPVRSVP